MLRSSLKHLLVAAACASAAHIASAETLARVYELALANDPVLKAAEASFKASSEAKNLARAALLPQVNGSYSYSQNDLDSSTIGLTAPATAGPDTPPDFTQLISGPVTSQDETDTKSLNIELQQNIFNLPAWYSFKQGKKLSELAAAQFAFDQQDLIVRVAEAYFNVLRAKENLDTAIAEETAIQRQLEQTEQRFEVGLIAITDVHESRAAHDLAVVTRLEAQGQLGIAYEALSVITGEQHSNIWLLSEEFPVTDPSPAQRSEWVEFALQNNYQLRAARLSENAAQHNAKAKRAEHLPKIVGSYSYVDSTTDGDRPTDSVFNPDPTVDDSRDGGTIGLSLSMPLFSGGSVSASRRQAAQEYIQARENHIASQRNTIQNTRSLHLSVITDVGKVNARKQAITSSESALEATQAGYEVGTRNIVDVLDAQRFLFRSVRDYSNARYDYVINMLRLKQQAGTLTPQEIYGLSKWLAQPPAPAASTTPQG